MLRRASVLGVLGLLVMGLVGLSLAGWFMGQGVGALLSAPSPVPLEDTPTPVPPTLTPISGSIPHPTGAKEIVIQVRSRFDGFFPEWIGVRVSDFPDFTLYGDGTVIYVDKRRFPTQALARSAFHQDQWDEAVVQDLLNRIVNTEHFFALSANQTPPNLCCDFGGMNIRVIAAGHDHAVANAPFQGSPDPGDPPDRTHWYAVRDAIYDRMAENAPLFTLAGATLCRGTPEPLYAKAVPWPVSSIDLSVVYTESEGAICQDLRGADAAAAFDAAPSPRWFSQNGRSYEVVVIPYLP
jgi:hypothetical protein